MTRPISTPTTRGLMAAALLVAAGFSVPRAAMPAEDGRALDLVVVGADDGRPLPGVTLSVILSTGSVSDAKRPPVEATDDEGRRRIDLPIGPWWFVGISARKEGYVPVRLRWNVDQLRTKLPESYRLRLERGATIGGVVRDEQGRPVEGAKVYPWLQGKENRDEFKEMYLDDEYHVETDALGRWRCTMMPAELGKDDRLMFRLTHPDYASEPANGYSRRLAFEQLRALGGVFVIPDGLTMSGRIADSQGRPIAGATAVLGGTSFAPMSEASATTDAGGRFRLAHVAAGRRFLRVEAPHYVMSGSEITVGPGQAPVEVRLAKYAETKRWVDELQAEEARKPDEWKRWLMLGVLAASMLAALVSWACARHRRPPAS